MRIAFIGLGNMGAPMAANLAKAGHEVTGFDTAGVTVEGVARAASSRDAIVGAAAIITMLPNGDIVRAVAQEIVDAAQAGALFIDCSTIDVESARAVHDLAKGAGLPSLDAPVSGGVGGAQAGTLTFMVGGSEEAYAKGAALFDIMGRKAVHCGEAGAGQAAKICNNMILGISMVAVAEGFVLAERLGLSHEALFEVASTSSGQCWSLTSYCPVPGPVPASPANNGYKPGFAVALMLKDLKLAQQAALTTGAATPLGAQAAQLYALFEGLGRGGDDFSGIINFVRGLGERAGP